jgi:hypothetical protein
MRLTTLLLGLAAGPAPAAGCNGTTPDCQVRVFVGPCPGIACGGGRSLRNSSCLHIDRGFHMATLEAALARRPEKICGL